MNRILIGGRVVIKIKDEFYGGREGIALNVFRTGAEIKFRDGSVKFFKYFQIEQKGE